MMAGDAKPPTIDRRILLLGATGTIGQAVLKVLVARGFDIVCLVRSGARTFPDLPEVEFRSCVLTDPASLSGDGFRSECFDMVISCMASRNGTAEDAWAVDYQAHLNVLQATQALGSEHFILLSSICAQRPLLAFQQAKLAFEEALIGSGLRYSIVRPTAYFKSLSGQVARVRAGKPFLLFGNGELTACKPISDTDLADYLADCIENPAMHNRILPIGGPGEAITPRQQGELLFQLLGKEPRFRHVPLWFFDAIIAVLKLGGMVSKRAEQKAELARIGRYYATESMLLLDPVTGRYDAAATPSTGTETLAQHYARLISGEAITQRSEHSVF